MGAGDLTEVFHHFLFKCYGTDAEGRPILIMNSNGPATKRFFEAYSEKAFVEMQFMVFERFERIVLPLCTRKAGKLIGETRPLTADQMIWIIHLEPDNFDELAEPKVKQAEDKFRGALMRNFPRLFHTVYILNMPKLYTVVFKAFSIFMSKESVDGIKLLGRDYHEALDKAIGLHRLPKCIGGTNPTPVEEHVNFFDKHFEKSFRVKKLGFV